MRISKVTLIILGVVVLAVGFGVLYMMYSRQLQEQDQLRAELSSNQAKLASLVKEQQSWQAQLAKAQEDIAARNAAVTAAQQELAAARSVWPNDAQTIEYEEKLFALADGRSLFVNVTTGAEPAAKAIQGVSFKTTSFTVTLTGGRIETGFDEVGKYQDYVYSVLGDILGYITDITNDDFFKTANIDVVNITVPSMPTREALLQAGTDLEQPTATISVTVYTYTGG